MSADLKTRTISDFGDQWTAYRENPGLYGDKETLGDIFGPLLSLADVKGARVADIGSGSGRIVNMLLDAGAEHVTAVEPSAAMSVLKNNTASRRDQVTYVEAPGDQLPSSLELNFAFSIGVLHHIPDPAPVVKAMHDALRSGGRILVWLYGREGNSLYLAVFLPLRTITTRMPDKALWRLSALLSWLLSGYIGCCKVLPLPMRSYMLNVLAKWTPEVRKVTIYDQLNPAYSKYYSENEAITLLASAGFANVRAYHRHGYSWTVTGTKAAQGAMV